MAHHFSNILKWCMIDQWETQQKNILGKGMESIQLLNSHNIYIHIYNWQYMYISDQSYRSHWKIYWDFTWSNILCIRKVFCFKIQCLKIQWKRQRLQRVQRVQCQYTNIELFSKVTIEFYSKHYLSAGIRLNSYLYHWIDFCYHWIVLSFIELFCNFTELYYCSIFCNRY